LWLRGSDPQSIKLINGVDPPLMLVANSCGMELESRKVGTARPGIHKRRCSRKEFLLHVKSPNIKSGRSIRIQDHLAGESIFIRDRDQGIAMARWHGVPTGQFIATAHGMDFRHRCLEPQRPWSALTSISDWQVRPANHWSARVFKIPGRKPLVFNSRLRRIPVVLILHLLERPDL
jgi:hypothetical protein